MRLLKILCIPFIFIFFPFQMRLESTLPQLSNLKFKKQQEKKRKDMARQQDLVTQFKELTKLLGMIR